MAISENVLKLFKQSPLFGDLTKELMKYKKKKSIHECDSFLLKTKELSDPKSNINSIALILTVRKSMVFANIPTLHRDLQISESPGDPRVRKLLQSFKQRQQVPGRQLLPRWRNKAIKSATKKIRRGIEKARLPTQAKHSPQTRSKTGKTTRTDQKTEH